MQEKIDAAAREAVEEIASAMLFVTIVPTSSAANGAETVADVSAIVGLSGGLKGGARLASPLETVTALASALIGEDVHELNAESEDAFGELANMITGGIQTRLAGELGNINLSPPVVITGNGHRARGYSGDRIARTEFELEGKPFFVEVFYSLDDR